MTAKSSHDHRPSPPSKVDQDNQQGSATTTATCCKPAKVPRYKPNNGERIRDQNGYRLRAAAVCVRDDMENEVSTQVLLVTAGRDHSCWVVPGGGIELNESPAEAAVREACEEAGAIGRIVRTLGIFVDEGRKHKTYVFVLRVSKELSTWQDGEHTGRMRQWLPIDTALPILKTSQKPYLHTVMVGKS